MAQLNPVTKREIHDAIKYLHEMGFVEELTTDKRHYVEILLKAGANQLNIKLEGI